jgi:N-acetylglucosaminyldiphosphoundecaprenol N-acetyl-beta-D-mannosaminyltransferase
MSKENLLKNYFDKLYKEDVNSFYELLKEKLKNNEKTFIVTANPETFTIGENDKEFNSLLNDENSILVPDGIGIVKAARMIGYNVKERITGIDIANMLLKNGNDLNKTIFFFGAKQEVIDSLIDVVNKNYKNLKIVGAVNGYEKDKDKIFEQMKLEGVPFTLKELKVTATDLIDLGYKGELIGKELKKLHSLTIKDAKNNNREFLLKTAKNDIGVI